MRGTAPLRGCRGFTIVELLVALLIAAVGIGAILNMFITTAAAAQRDARRAQLHALGRGLVACWQQMPREEVRDLLADGDGKWPAESVAAEIAPETELTCEWQWRWDGALPASGPMVLELHLSTDWDASGETVRLPATL